MKLSVQPIVAYTRDSLVSHLEQNILERQAKLQELLATTNLKELEAEYFKNAVDDLNALFSRIKKVWLSKRNSLLKRRSNEPVKIDAGWSSEIIFDEILARNIQEPDRLFISSGSATIRHFEDSWEWRQFQYAKLNLESEIRELNISLALLTTLPEQVFLHAELAKKLGLLDEILKTCEHLLNYNYRG